MVSIRDYNGIKHSVVKILIALALILGYVNSAGYVMQQDYVSKRHNWACSNWGSTTLPQTLTDCLAWCGNWLYCEWSTTKCGVDFQCARWDTSCITFEPFACNFRMYKYIDCGMELNTRFPLYSNSQTVNYNPSGGTIPLTTNYEEVFLHSNKLDCPLNACSLKAPNCVDPLSASNDVTLDPVTFSILLSELNQKGNLVDFCFECVL